MSKRYCFRVEDADELQGCEMSVAAAEQAAREHAAEHRYGRTKFEIFDCRPATAADAEMWEACNCDDEVLSKWVPENVVHTFIYDPVLKSKPAT